MSDERKFGMMWGFTLGISTALSIWAHPAFILGGALAFFGCWAFGQCPAPDQRQPETK